MTETMQAVNTVMDSDSYALVLRTIERNALLDQRDELIAQRDELLELLQEVVFASRGFVEEKYLRDARAALAKAGVK